jgi:hypothetical protein
MFRWREPAAVIAGWGQGPQAVQGPVPSSSNSACWPAGGRAPGPGAGRPWRALRPGPGPSKSDWDWECM